MRLKCIKKNLSGAVDETHIETFFGDIDTDDPQSVLILVCVFHNLKKVFIKSELWIETFIVGLAARISI
jgi:hypothetical protein